MTRGERRHLKKTVLDLSRAANELLAFGGIALVQAKRRDLPGLHASARRLASAASFALVTARVLEECSLSPAEQEAADAAIRRARRRAHIPAPSPS